MEQEDQRLTKHDDLWMDIVRSPQLESFIFTKLTKPCIRVNLVDPQVSLQIRWVPLCSGGIFLCVIRRHFLACEDIAGGSELSAGGGCFFCEIQIPFRWVPTVRRRNH